MLVNDVWRRFQTLSILRYKQIVSSDVRVRLILS